MCENAIQNFLTEIFISKELFSLWSDRYVDWLVGWVVFMLLLLLCFSSHYLFLSFVIFIFRSWKLNANDVILLQYSIDCELYVRVPELLIHVSCDADSPTCDVMWGRCGGMRWFPTVVWWWMKCLLIVSKWMTVYVWENFSHFPPSEEFMRERAIECVVLRAGELERYCWRDDFHCYTLHTLNFTGNFTSTTHSIFFVSETEVKISFRMW